MKGLALLVVLMLCKAAVLWDRPVPWSATAIAGYFWQDVLVALAFTAFEAGSNRTRIGRRLIAPLYWAIVLYAAINVPVARVLSTPLTWPMLQATRSTLADSILAYVTWPHAAIIAVILAAATLPCVLARTPPRARHALLAMALVLAASGPMAVARLDTLGLHRTPILALWASVLPRVDARGGEADWTAPPLDAPAGDDLSDLRGLAAGRHVIIVSLESTGAQYLRLYGGSHDVTPRLDALARHAVVFDRAYATTPESIKGLFSILCSRYPAFDTSSDAYAATACPSIARVLAAAGYRTALFHSGRFAYLGMEAVVRDRGFEVLEDAGDIGGVRESSFGVDDPATVDRMLAWIDGLDRDERFLLAYLPIAGHHPYDTPEPGPFPADDDLGRYRNAVHYGDAALGAFIDGLRARGLFDETLWIVYGDHGQAFGQHEGNYGHTFFLYEENVRVPFLIAAPGAIAHPVRSRTTVSLVDVAPTALALLGIAKPDAYQGRSALGGEPRMALFFTDYSLSLVGLRDGRWKMVHDLGSGRSKLFDLETDPGEQVDVSPQHPLRVAAYRRRLEDWSSAQKALLQADRAPY